MKKLFVISILLLFAVSAFAEGLNPEATKLKMDNPDVYGTIRTRAVMEWGTDHEMIVYVINKQSKSLFEVAALAPKLNDVEFYTILSDWCDDDLNQYDAIFSAPIDWSMVEYVMKKQIEAKSQY